MALIQLRQKEAEERMGKLRESIRREQAEAAAKAQEEALQASQPLHHLRAQKKKPAEAAVAALAPSQGSEEEEADWNADDDDEAFRSLMPRACASWSLRQAQKTRLTSR